MGKNSRWKYLIYSGCLCRCGFFVLYRNQCKRRDVSYSVFYLTGILYLLLKHLHLCRKIPLLFVTLIFVVAITTISWHFILQPIYHGTELEFLLITLAYPVKALAVLFAIFAHDRAKSSCGNYIN